MNHIHVFPSIILHFVIISIFFFLIFVPPSYCDDYDEQLSACRRPYLYPCGSSRLNILYPFWGGDRLPYCGRKGFEIKCDKDNEYHFIESDTQKFRVLNINDTSPIMTIARYDLWNDNCPGIVTQEIAFDQNLFKYGPNVRNLSLFYDCREVINPQNSNYVSCKVGDEEKTGFYAIDITELQLPNLTDTCTKGIKVPVQLAALEDLRPGNLEQALKQGFDVEYNTDNILCAKCLATLGICASNSSNSEQFICLCTDEREPQAHSCPPQPAGRKPTPRRKVIIGIGAAVGGIIVTICIIILRLILKSSSFIWETSKNNQDLEAFIRNHGSLSPKRYSFLNVKKMTNSFKEKLGQGGYGGVYKGKLPDGQLVAVKLLNTSKGNGQEFINEVASISRTSHINIVTLVGFCLEGSKRALIYEFMPNGSLEKFIHTKDALKTDQHLGWEKLYQIALGIARGLEYLHLGCSTKILHFDIKPHNILLDEDFCPKISDFGLAKLCTRKESIVSMLEARGTIGYVAPEIFCRNFGEVSHKSDVYSYGMMILEMVGGRKNLHLGVDNSSEIYFPKWIYKHLELGEEVKLLDAMNAEEKEIAEKMIIVGLWCIQSSPLDRPSINKVIDMLQGSIKVLQIPPNPFHSSSPRATSIDSATLSIS
ncbi:hypothetical protein ACOSQ3_026340 [Xanthoceras sorbifolium]